MTNSTRPSIKDNYTNKNNHDRQSRSWSVVTITSTVSTSGCYQMWSDNGIPIPTLTIPLWLGLVFHLSFQHVFRHRYLHYYQPYLHEREWKRMKRERDRVRHLLSGIMVKRHICQYQCLPSFAVHMRLRLVTSTDRHIYRSSSSERKRYTRLERFSVHSSFALIVLLWY